LSINAVNPKLEHLLLSNEDVISRQQALSVVADHALEYAVRRAQITQLLPRVYIRAGRDDDARVRIRASLMYVGDDAMLSHLTALTYWSLPAPAALPSIVHVTVPRGTCRQSRPGVIVIHRATYPFSWVRRGEARVSRLERAVVDSWPLVTGPDQRAPAIVAVAERRTTPQRLRREALGRSNLRGRASLLALCDALEDGCRSELELWGLRHVFRDDPRFAHGVRQLPVQMGSRVAYLDLAFVAERVAVELDGAAYHGTPEQRERDMRRDAALSALGWIVLRFSYQRLHTDPDGVRNEVDAVLCTRRRQLTA
jgi:very-short-patch-repair endonuclease